MGNILPWLLLAAAAVVALCEARGGGDGQLAGEEGPAGLARQAREAQSPRFKKSSKKEFGKSKKAQLSSRKDKRKKKNTNKNDKSRRKTKKQKKGKKKSKNGKRRPKKFKKKRQRKHRKQDKTSKIRKKAKQKKGKKVRLNEAESRNATCSGSSLGDSCLANLLTAMKFEKDKIRTFTNQKKRAESFKKITEAKGGKNGQFGNTTVYLLFALGGNLSNLACAGRPSLTAEAVSTYTTLNNCSVSIPASCAIPNNTANFTLLDTCETVYKAIQTKNKACLAETTDGAAACSCWKEAANMTMAAKGLAADCDSQGAQKKMKDLKKTCMETFTGCKKAEDSSVSYILTCSSSSSSSSTSTNSTTNSTITKLRRDTSSLLQLQPFLDSLRLSNL